MTEKFFKQEKSEGVPAQITSEPIVQSEEEVLQLLERVSEQVPEDTVPQSEKSNHVSDEPLHRVKTTEVVKQERDSAASPHGFKEMKS